MPDVVGYRAKIGVIVPSTNTVVEHDFARVRPPGVTFHSGRFLVEAPDLSTDEAFLHFLDLIRETIPTAVRDIMTCEPDHLLMGMSAETFWGGKEGNAAFSARVAAIAGEIGITSGAAACNAALGKLGVSRIACLTPYQPAADEQVYGYFSECGLDVKRVHGLRCESATSIADVTPETLVEVLKASMVMTSTQSCNAAPTFRWSKWPIRPNVGSANPCWPSMRSACGMHCAPSV